MTNIDFYILGDDTLVARDHFACRLAEKAIAMGRHIVIFVNDKSHGESISHYLWSFKPESFIPHSLANDKTTQCNDKVIIAWEDPDDTFHDVLINLKHEMPTNFSRFSKVAEIVVQDTELLPITRKHFQFYRERGYPLKSHKIR